MNITSTTIPYDYKVLTEDTKILINEFPEVQKIKIGTSVLGRELFCLKFGKGDKKVFVNAAHHGNEWITSALVMRMLEELCFLHKNNMSSGSFDIKSLFNSSSLYICPMVNPDGVNLSIHGLTCDIPQIIKTRLLSYNGESHDFFGKWQANINGVDLNHNYDAGFLKGKAFEAKKNIFCPCASQYSGSYPESEPETKALASFTKDLFPDITVSYHSQGEEIYYDFEGKIPPSSEHIAKNLAEISGYKACQPNGMASFSGYKDWVIDKFLIPSFTIEVGKGKNPLPLSDFNDIFDKNFPLLMYLLK